MATKTTKRKRAAAPVASTPVDAPVAPTNVTSVAVETAASGEPLVSLSSNSTVKDAAALKSTLLQVLDAPGCVAIDAKSVERIDTAVIQVLCAFVRDRAARNLAVMWRGTPQPLLDAARLLGVGALLALPSQAEA
jgi:ABC-type transporter Mla MlaB component